MRIWGDVEGGGLVKRREGSGGDVLGCSGLAGWMGGTYGRFYDVKIFFLFGLVDWI